MVYYYYIPVEIVRNILSRLPGESQVRFKIVCKEWQSIMNDDPAFPKQQVDMLFIYDRRQQQPCAIPLCSLSKTTTRCSYTIYAKNINTNFDWKNSHSSVQQTHCHGFLLLYNSNFTNCALWSPFSGERIELPRIGYNYYGLGYDLKSDDYKVVVLKNGNSETCIYSLKSQAWHKIGDFPKVDVPFCSFPLFANDALYWLARQGRQQVVISLHLSTETYSVCHSLCDCSFGHSLCDCSFGHSLYVLEGCLFLLCTRYFNYNKDVEWCKDAEWNLWILKDCKTGNGKEWNKLITLGKKNIHGSWPYRYMIDPVAYVKSKEQVVIRNDEKFMWFDLKSNKCLKTVTIDGIGSASCQVLPASHGWFSENHENGLKLDIQTSLCLDSSGLVQLH